MPSDLAKNSPILMKVWGLAKKRAGKIRRKNKSSDFRSLATRLFIDMVMKDTKLIEEYEMIHGHQPRNKSDKAL